MADQPSAKDRPDRIYQLVYLSRSRMSAQPEDVAEELRDILAVARTFNARAGITGALLFSGERFAQVLEGPRQAVLTLMDHIRCDRRHHDVVILQEGYVAVRNFGSWSMAFMDEQSCRLIRLSSSGDFRGMPVAGRGRVILDMMRYLLSGQEEETGP
ncbi:MAG: BLUF domain-containing protein [Acetobacteraceae bacterium]